jgi:hypothetical protein
MAWPLMTLRRLLAVSVVALPRLHGMKDVAAPAPAAAPVADNAMANTYGFLRKSSNNVGNAVENVLGIEGSLDDMHKDLDEEYKRWLIKKKVLLAEQEKLKSETSRLKGDLLLQKKMRADKERIEGRVRIQKEDNKNQAEANKEARMKWALEKKGLETEIKALQCQTKSVQKIKQVRVDTSNQESFRLKDKNRAYQQQVFQLNKELANLTAAAVTQKINDKKIASDLLSKVEGLQKQIHGLETELLAQAQMEEMVQRARERLLAQTDETVKQRNKIKEGQEKCLNTKHQMENDVEAAKKLLNQANTEMAQCQNLDGENQKIQAALNECVLQKRSLR